MIFGFVILHYMDYDTTLRCIQKILKLSSDEYSIEIVVIDNGSSNDTGIKLKNYFRDVKNVCIYLESNNIGFANGNNAGYRLLKSKHNIDYMLIINNDIIIEDNMFLNKIVQEYKKSKFDVLGPDIVSLKDYGHQNPAHNKSFSINELIEIKRRNKKFIKLFYLYRIAHYFKKSSAIEKKIIFFEKERLFNVVLHGSCYILSKNIINSRKNIFFNKTFMYFEEDIFHFECLRDGYKIVYSPYLKVFHIEDASTDFIEKNKARKNLKKAKLMNDSIDELIKMKKKAKY